MMGGLGLAPISASPLYSSNRIECASLKIRHHCNEMKNGSSQLAAPENTSCCFITGLPMQGLPFVLPASSSAAMPTTIPVSFGDTPRVRNVPPDIPWHTFSLPASLSRLCTFLI
jgi:hypothetical protein